MNISIVIPNYNGAENLKKNLPRVLASMKKSQHKTELIVVDDASKDESIEYLNSLVGTDLLVCPLHLVQNPKNLGFAASCNIGVKKAKGEIVVLLNTDVYPDENFIEPLIKYFQDKKVFAVGCLEKTLDENGKIIGEKGVSKLFFKDGIFQHCAGDLNSKTTDWVCGGSGAFSRDIFLKLGGFDTRFAPFYWEDIDLSYRAKKAEYKLFFEKDSIVYHQHNVGTIATRYTPYEINKISYDNQLKFTEKHAVGWQKFLFIIFRLINLGGNFF